jgi:hypothetical protein
MNRGSNPDTGKRYFPKRNSSLNLLSLYPHIIWEVGVKPLECEADDKPRLVTSLRISGAKTPIPYCFHSLSCDTLFTRISNFITFHVLFLRFPGIIRF